MAAQSKRVTRIMQENNLLAIRARKFVFTTDSRHELEVYLNLAARLKLTGPPLRQRPENVRTLRWPRPMDGTVIGTADGVPNPAAPKCDTLLGARPISRRNCGCTR